MPAMRRKDSLARWKLFKARHRGHPALHEETLYALPPKLLTAIENEAPALLDRHERRFEQDLSRYSGVGFYRERLITFPLLPGMPPAPLSANERQWNQRVEKTGKALDQLGDDLLSSLGRNPLQIEEHRRRFERFQQRIVERQRGYAGWLLTQAAFREERDSYCAKWQKESRRQMVRFGMPASLSSLQFTTAAESDRAFHGDTAKFLWKWGLQGLATSELPVPIDPGLHRPNFGSPHDLRAAGTVLFVPWYFVVDKNLRLEEFIEHQRQELSLSHLADWTRGRESRRWGFARYAVMLQLYVWIELALAKRYPGRLAGQFFRLDRAFARFGLGDDESVDQARIDHRADSIRRIRRKMGSRIGQDTEPVVTRATTRR
jgi:hypothetical protein